MLGAVVDSDPDDAELEEELRRVADHVDPVPLDVIERSAESLTWRTVDAELAELAFDSLVDGDRTSGLVRGPGDVRTLTFRASHLTIELDISFERGAREVIGQLVPAQPMTLEIRHKDGAVVVEADDLGRFSAEALPAGPFSVRCGSDNAARPILVTDWISV
jgi:hypothetical protein